MRQRRGVGSGAPALLASHHQSFALQQLSNGAGRRPAAPQLVPLQNALELPRSSAHLRLPQTKHLLLDLLWHLVVMPVRRAALLDQPGGSRFVVTP
jgi:hypothetical protein